MNLEQMYPVIRDRIREAKKAGFKDEEIHDIIQKEMIKPALEAGVKPREILDFMQQRPLVTRAIEAIGELAPAGITVPEIPTPKPVEKPEIPIKRPEVPKKKPEPKKYIIPFEPEIERKQADIYLQKFKPPTKSDYIKAGIEPPREMIPLEVYYPEQKDVIHKARQLGYTEEQIYPVFKKLLGSKEKRYEDYKTPINYAKDFLKGLAVIPMSLPQVAGSLMQELGETAIQKMEYWERVGRETPYDPILKKDTREKVKDLIDNYIINTGKEIIEKNKTVLEARGIKPHPTDKISQWLFKGGAGFGSLGSAIGLTLLTGNPTAASAAFGVLQKSQVYQEARAAGKSPAEAATISTAAGTIEAGLEKIGLDFFLRKYGGTLYNVAFRTGSESLQEASQELGYNIVAKLGYEPSRRLMEGVMESAILGAIVGAPVAAVIPEMARGEMGSILMDAGIDPMSSEGQMILTNLYLENRKEVVSSIKDLKEKPITDEEKTAITKLEIAEKTVDLKDVEKREPDIALIDDNVEKTAVKIREATGRPLLPEEKRKIEEAHIDREAGVDKEAREDVSFVLLLDLGYMPEQIYKMTMDTKVYLVDKELNAKFVSILPDGSFSQVTEPKVEPSSPDPHPTKPVDIEVPTDFTYFSNIIKDEGGIAPYDSKYLNEDYYARIPLYMRRKGGMRIDEWAERFGMTEDELINMIEREQKAHRDFIDEMREAAVNKEAIYGEETTEEEFLNDTPNIGLAIKEVVPKEIEGRPVTLTRRPKDIARYSFERFLAPVRALAKKHPLAAKIAHLGRDTYLFMRNEQLKTSNHITSLYKGIREKRRIYIGQLLDKEPTIEELNTLSKKERQAYEGTRNLLKRAKEMARKMGIDVSKWSIPDDAYFPHIFIGQYQIIVGDKIIGFATDLNECFYKARLYLVENKNDKGAVWIKPRMPYMDYPPVILSRKGFFAFMRRVEEATTISPDQLQAILDRGQWVTEEEVTGITEKRFTEKGEPIEAAKEAPKIEKKVKEALLARGWHEGEVDQMVRRLKESKTQAEAESQVNTIVERTIERLKKVKKVYTVGDLQTVKQDVYGALRGIVAMRPRRKYVGNFLHRTANLGGFLEDPQIAVMIYMNRVIRKSYIDPFRKTVEDLADQLPSGLREYFRQYIDGISGTYSGDESFLVKHIIPFITKATSWLKLGYRPSSAIINRLQPFQLAYGEIGNYVFWGEKFMHTQEGKTVIERSGVLDLPSKFYALEGGIPADVRFWEALYMFHKSEQNARKQVLAGSYLFAKKIFGMDRAIAEKKGFGYIQNYLIDNNNDVDKAALAYGRDVIADTMFLYDISDLPLALRSPVGRMVFQFRNYTINSLYQAGAWLQETTTNPTPHNIARVVRMIGSNLLLGGIKLPLAVADIIMPTSLKKAIFLGLLTSILTEDDELRKKVKLTIYNGVFSLLGVDISKRLAPDIYIPQNPVDIFGVAVSDFNKLYKAYKAGEPLDKIIPEIWLAAKIPLKIRKYWWQGHTVKGYRDRPELVNATAWEKFFDALDFTPTRLGMIRTVDQLSNKETEDLALRRKVYVDRILEAMSAEDSQKADEIFREAMEAGMGITPEMIKLEWNKKLQPRVYRMFKEMPTPVREEYLTILDELSK